jgi:hypothetical protein
MGLHISVSDRLVTYGDTGGVFEDKFNKTILCFTEDSILVVSFTGQAHVGGLPFDSWIASQLVNAKIDSRAVNAFGVYSGPRNCRTLVSRIVRSLRSEFLVNNVEIRISGYIFVRGMALPYFLRIKKIGLLKNIIFGKMDTWSLCRKGGFFISLSSGWAHVERRIVRNAIVKLQSGPPEGVSFEQFSVDVMVNMLREFAQKHDSIGGELMVLKNSLRDQKVEISYQNINGFSPISELNGLFSDIPATFIPWIITLSSCHQPSILRGGGFRARVYGFLIEVIGPAFLEKGIFAWSEMPRRRP